MKAERKRNLLFALFCVVVTASVVCYAFYANSRSVPQSEHLATTSLATGTNHTPVGAPYLAFRNTALGPDYGRLCFVSLDATDGPRTPGKLVCDRVHTTADLGIALQASRRVMTTYKAVVFDADGNV